MRGAEPTSQGQGPGSGGGFPTDQPSQGGGREATAMLLVGQAVQALRRLGMMYPAAAEDIRSMLNGMARVQGKIVNSKPAPETSAPPI